MRILLATLALTALTGCTYDLGFPWADRGEKVRKPLDYDPPANLPPEGYTGDIWVDTEGCIFLRSEQETWVPRVNQKRVQMCDKASMQAYLDREDPRGETQIAEPQAVSENALNVQQALAVVSIENPKPAPGNVAPLPSGKTATYVQVDPTELALSFTEARAKFKARKHPVYSADKSSGVIVLGPFDKALDVQDALVSAWSFGFLDAYPFKK